MKRNNAYVPLTLTLSLYGEGNRYGIPPHQSLSRTPIRDMQHCKAASSTGFTPLTLTLSLDREGIFDALQKAFLCYN